MTKINGNAYPLYDDVRGQKEVYDYFLARDLEQALRDMREERQEALEPELEEVE